MQNISSSAFADTKPHYELLDGLRGVAALLVIWYHVFEGFATSPVDQWLNHGYLAVDFFFILSGFVIGYAYDDRWKSTMDVKGFFKRRLIRLHPMVVMGAVLGAVTFLHTRMRAVGRYAGGGFFGPACYPFEFFYDTRFTGGGTGGAGQRGDVSFEWSCLVAFF